MNPTLKRILYVSLGYIAIGGGIMWLLCDNCFKDWANTGKSLLFGTVVCVAFWEGNGRISDYITQRVSWVNEPVKRLILGVLTTTLYTGLVMALVSFFAAKYMWGFPEDRIWANVWGNVVVALGITVIVSLILHSKGFFETWREAEVRAEQLEKEQLKSQYSSLKNQLNPHFLFNSLNALSSLVYIDADKSARFIKQLSEIYRYVLENAEKEVVLLASEMAFIRSYLFLLGIRFDENLKVEINVPEQSSYVLPPMSLQLLVENAIKHNVISAAYPLNLSIRAEGDTLVVENSLRKKTEVSPSTGVGLENIRARYGMLSDVNVEVVEKPEAFEVRLPLLTLKNE